MSANVELGMNVLGKVCDALGINGPVRRVIIDIPHNDAVKVYVERFAEKDQLEIVLPILKGGGFEVIKAIDVTSTKSPQGFQEFAPAPKKWPADV